MSRRKEASTQLDIHDFDRCTINLEGDNVGIEEVVDTVEYRDKSQRCDRNNGDGCGSNNDNVEMRDKNEISNGAIITRSGKEILPSKYGLVKVKDVFLKLYQNLTCCGPTGITSLGQILEMNDNMNSNREESKELKLGKFIVKGLNLFIIGVIMREPEVKISVQFQAQKTSTPVLRFSHEEIV